MMSYLIIDSCLTFWFSLIHRFINLLIISEVNYLRLTAYYAVQITSSLWSLLCFPQLFRYSCFWRAGVFIFILFNHLFLHTPYNVKPSCFRHNWVLCPQWGLLVSKSELIDSKWFGKSHNEYSVKVHSNVYLKMAALFVMRCAIWYHLYNFKKREKHPWTSVTFSKVGGFAQNITIKKLRRF